MEINTAHKNYDPEFNMMIFKTSKNTVRNLRTKLIEISKKAFKIFEINHFSLNRDCKDQS